jgi:hypothetical protein
VADTDLILMQNPDLPGTAPTTTTEAAFRQVWQPRGFERVDPAVQAAGEVLGEPIADLESLTKAQLLEVAANLGIEGVSTRTSNAEIIQTIRDSDQFAAAAEED